MLLPAAQSCCRVLALPCSSEQQHPHKRMANMHTMSAFKPGCVDPAGTPAAHTYLAGLCQDLLCVHASQ